MTATLIFDIETIPDVAGLRTLHRPANLEDLFLDLTGGEVQESMP